MSTHLHPLDHEARALWHLELLGCHAPEDAVAPYEAEPVRDWYDPDDDSSYLGEAVTCWGCGGEGFVITCCDDLCHGAGYCFHGDGEAVCRECLGEGSL